MAVPLFTKKGRWERPGFPQHSVFCNFFEKLLGSKDSAPADPLQSWHPGHWKTQLRGLPGGSHGWSGAGESAEASRSHWAGCLQRAILPRSVSRYNTGCPHAGIRGPPTCQLHSATVLQPWPVPSANTHGCSTSFPLGGHWSSLRPPPVGQLLLYGRYPVA